MMRMRLQVVLVPLLATTAAPLAAGSEPVTASNWRRHPAIAEIRAIYQETRQAGAAGRLQKEQRTIGYCLPYEDAERTLYLGANGAVRSYHRGAGSEDSAVQAAYYYDRDGALRFVLVKAGAVNGTAYEYRIYLSKAGKRLWEERRHLKGPGYTFPGQWPEDWLVWDPMQAFHAKAPCADEK
jgi:hypothetical protein